MPPRCSSTGSTPEPPAEAGWSRRRFLTASGVVAAGSATTIMGTRPAGAEARRGRLAAFAMITDTHINPEHPDRSDRLTTVLNHLRTRDPAFVLHCGDLTDTGSEIELELYDSLLPDDLRDRVHHVPGNHEQMWNVDALERYRHLVGATHSAFTAGGYRLIGLDPMVSMEAGAHYFGADRLAWFERELRHTPSTTPVVCFVHFPLGGKWHYVADGDQFLRLASRHGVRGILCGHRHKLEVDAFNGITQIIGKAIRGVPVYYWAQPTPDGLSITEVLVAEDGTAQETKVATIPLRHGPGEDLGPFHATAQPDGDTARVSVRLPATATAGSVVAQLYPQGGTVAGWSPLTGSGRTWSGQVPITGLPPGRHRIEVRAVGADGGLFDDNVSLTIPEHEARVAWSHRMPGRIRAEITERDGLAVVGSIGGVVDALHPTEQAARRQWRAHIGPVYKRAVFSPDGDLLIIPSADHHLYALDPAHGHRRWRLNLGVPVLCDPVLVTLGRRHRIIAVAGATLHCVTLDGAVVWRQTLPGISAGRVACDGDRIFVGSGDGRTRALDARTGAELWSTLTTPKDSLYHDLAYGSWAAHLKLLPGNAVLVGIFNNLLSLDRDTGELLWSTPETSRQVLYTPPTLTEHGILWFDGAAGTAYLSDPHTGTQLWSTPAFPMTRDTAPVRLGSSDVYWMVGAPGTAARLDLSHRTIETVLQISTEFAFTTPAVVGAAGRRVLVSGAQDGMVHGVIGMLE